METFGDRFWDVVCLFTTQAYVLLAVSTSLLALTLFSWLNTTPGSEARAISRFTFAVLLVNIVVLAAIVTKCRSRDL
ncbi:hypothetical protein ACFQMA_17005 [Halosimplex aquaticum]|uniref:Uncharacterized protein n=1 Tax=Halosimplex aquaticum TaxID=3026162 RepID=A0ABD5Y2I6_9EURY|nr:hypothetical protein [Halosimplex aquaticum]